MESAIGLIFGAVIWGISWAITADKIMEGKGYDDHSTWQIYGFFFGIFAVFVAMSRPPAVLFEIKRLLANGTPSGAPSAPPLRYGTPTVGSAPVPHNSGSTWRCPKCGEVNPSAKRICKGCGHEK